MTKPPGILIHITDLSMRQKPTLASRLPVGAGFGGTSGSTPTANGMCGNRIGPIKSGVPEGNPLNLLLRRSRPFPLSEVATLLISSFDTAHFPSPFAPAPGVYHDQAHAELVGTFRDHYGYIAALHAGGLQADGEATLYTALAVLALAAGNNHQDAWEATNADDRIAELLTTLRDQSWGNQDGLGRVHPIRHPDVYDYDEPGNKIRNSPLTKDSFGAIVAAAYYAYFCPHSSERVRGLARDLMRKWSEYLVLNQWRTHSTYIAGEFETVPKKKRDPVTGEWKDSDDSAYKYIFGPPGNNEPLVERQVDAKGPESFLLLPHELYALRNVAAKLGIPTTQWDIWSNELPAELKQTIADVAAPYLADAAGRGLDYILQRLGYAIPYSIPLGPPEWNFGKVEGVFEVKIPSDDRQRIVAGFRDVVRDVIKEAVRLNNFRDNQAGDLIGLAVNRVLDIFPNSLGPNKWRSILVGAVQQVVPWLSSAGWVEAATFLGTLAFLRLTADKKADVVSYTLWVYAVECETRPEMEDILKPFVQEFFSYVRGHDNPNGLWAWLAEDTGRVHDEIALFESNHPRTWSNFAFGSAKFDEWLNKREPNPETAKDQFPRLDYLLLKALDEKGPPRGVTDVLADWWHAFEDAVGDASQLFIESVKEQFERLGQFSRDAIDAVGNLIRETWTKTGQYIQEQFRDGRLVLKQAWDQTGSMLLRFTEQLDGRWIEEYWNRAGERYWKGIWDKGGEVRKMLYRFLEDAGGKWIEEYWNRAGERYWKGIWDKAGEVRRCSPGSSRTPGASGSRSTGTGPARGTGRGSGTRPAKAPRCSPGSSRTPGASGSRSTGTGPARGTGRGSGTRPAKAPGCSPGSSRTPGAS